MNASKDFNLNKTWYHTILHVNVTHTNAHSQNVSWCFVRRRRTKTKNKRTKKSKFCCGTWKRVFGRDDFWNKMFLLGGRPMFYFSPPKGGMKSHKTDVIWKVIPHTPGTIQHTTVLYNHEYRCRAYVNTQLLKIPPPSPPHAHTHTQILNSVKQIAMKPINKTKEVNDNRHTHCSVIYFIRPINTWREHCTIHKDSTWTFTWHTWRYFFSPMSSISSSSIWNRAKQIMKNTKKKTENYRLSSSTTEGAKILLLWCSFSSLICAVEEENFPLLMTDCLYS